jgi:hypothetical protein
MPADRIRQRLQQARHPADPIGQGRARQIDAVAFEDLALAIKRGVISVFADQDMGQQARPGSFAGKSIPRIVF